MPAHIFKAIVLVTSENSDEPEVADENQILEDVEQEREDFNQSLSDRQFL